ncbi:MAG: nicotinate-nucleotide adenylyltransferase [Alphaproteobacteria bacterium]
MAKALGGHLPGAGQRIGLLGGSFNPAHAGHRAISTTALRRLRLDAVWWLVAPQNPLKAKAGTAPLRDRVAAAEAIAHHPRIVVSALEETLGTVYTADTVAALARRFPRVRFVWLMGADNLLHISHWRRWPQIFATVAVAVLDRPTYSLRALAAPAARRFARQRIDERAARRLTERQPPIWVFIRHRLSAQSSTGIRRTRQPE